MLYRNLDGAIPLIIIIIIVKWKCLFYGLDVDLGTGTGSVY